ncbi:MAG: hypothetical protein Q8R13_05990 [bacterium]|nr:hypothetical protein [bacterium]
MARRQIARKEVAHDEHERTADKTVAESAGENVLHPSAVAAQQSSNEPSALGYHERFGSYSLLR